MWNFHRHQNKCPTAQCYHCWLRATTACWWHHSDTVQTGSYSCKQHIKHWWDNSKLIDNINKLYALRQNCQPANQIYQTSVCVIFVFIISNLTSCCIGRSLQLQLHNEFQSGVSNVGHNSPFSSHLCLSVVASVQKRSSLSNQSRMPWLLSNNDGKLSQISSLFHRNNSAWSKCWSFVCSKKPTDGDTSDCDETRSWLKNFGESTTNTQYSISAYSIVVY